jgi:hypothetical protein
MCSAVSEANQPLSAWDRLIGEQPVPVPVPAPEPLFIVRLFDMFDGWIDISPAVPKAEADRIWNQRTQNGTRNIRYEEGDYYAIYPADTRMLVTPEFLGR